ncbi:MAG: guanylate kinase [Pseudomonadota bacterium]|jgi:guanylate kinase
MTSITAGHIFIVSAPSGAGKTSLVKALLDDPDSRIRLSISTTTRPPRPGEQEGREYFFTSREDFQARARAGEFIEWAEVHSNLYGTSRTTIAQALGRGERVLLEIDWQGAAQVRGQFPAQVTSIFILPPSLDELRRRLQARGQDTEAVIEARVQAAEAEMAHAPEFDHVIMNQDFSVAYEALKALVTR